MSLLSSKDELANIAKVLTHFHRLPFSGDTIPGSVMEAVLAHVRDADVLNTYDFIDVVSRTTKCGWQVKSTKVTTPVTWKRAKIPNSVELIARSQEGESGCKALGNAIIAFCNDHAVESMRAYELEQIGYSRLILHNGGKATYFEKVLCTTLAPQVFNPDEFEWHWSTPKQTVKKEQLQALHGSHLPTKRKWWAWHGLGENQLHFSGESSWWPAPGDPHRIDFELNSENKFDLEDLIALLDNS